MARAKKHAQRTAKGCKLCGDPDIGRGIEKHVKQGHGMDYAHYRQCFYKSGQVITDQLLDTGSTTKKGTMRVVLHVLVKRFVVPIT